MIKIIKSQHGSAMLLMTFFVMVSILIISLSLSAIVVNGLKLSTDQVQSTKAFFAAEAGAERILWEIRKNGNDPGITEPGDFCEANPAQFCFVNNSQGALSRCVADCTVESLFNDQVLTSNNSIYSVDFKYNNIDPRPVTLNSYGKYNIINRVIELKY